MQIEANGRGAAHMRVAAQGHTEGGVGGVHVLFVFPAGRAACVLLRGSAAHCVCAGGAALALQHPRVVLGG